MSTASFEGSVVSWWWARTVGVVLARDFEYGREGQHILVHDGTDLVRDMLVD